MPTLRVVKILSALLCTCALVVLYQNCDTHDLVGDRPQPTAPTPLVKGADRSLVLAKDTSDAVDLTLWVRRWLFTGLNSTTWRQGEFVLPQDLSDQQVLEVEVVSNKLLIRPLSVGRTVITLTRTKGSSTEAEGEEPGPVSRSLEIFVVPRVESSNEDEGVVLTGPAYVVEGAQALFSLKADSDNTKRVFNGFLGVDYEGAKVFGAFDDTCCQPDSADCAILDRTGEGEGLDFCFSLPMEAVHYKWAEDKNTNAQLAFYTGAGSGGLPLPHQAFVHIVNEDESLDEQHDPHKAQYVWQGSGSGARERYEAFSVVLKSSALSSDDVVGVETQIASAGVANKIGAPSFFTTRSNQSSNNNTTPAQASEAYVLCRAQDDTSCSSSPSPVTASFQKVSTGNADEEAKLVLSWPCPPQSVRHNIAKGPESTDEQCAPTRTAIQSQSLALANQPIVGYRVEMCACAANACASECGKSSRNWETLEHRGRVVQNVFDEKFWSLTSRHIEKLGIYIGTNQDHAGYLRRHASTSTPASNVRSSSGRFVAIVLPFNRSVGQEYKFRVAALNAAGVHSSPSLASETTPPPSPEDKIYLGFKKTADQVVTCYEADFNVDGGIKTSLKTNTEHRVHNCKVVVQLTTAEGEPTRFSSDLKARLSWPVMQVQVGNSTKCNWRTIRGDSLRTKFLANTDETGCASPQDVFRPPFPSALTLVEFSKFLINLRWILNPTLLANTNEYPIILIIKNDTQDEPDEYFAFELAPLSETTDGVEGGNNRVFLRPAGHSSRTSPPIKIIDDDDEA